jgi:hypothetical protein
MVQTDGFQVFIVKAGGVIAQRFWHFAAIYG